MNIIDALEQERLRKSIEESARQLAAGTLPVIPDGVRPIWKGEAQRVAATNPPVDLGPAIADPSDTRGLYPDQNQILQQHQANLDAIASMKRGEMPPRLAQKLQEIRAARGSNPTPNPLLDAIGAASGYRRGYGNGYAYGFGGGGGFNPSSMSSEAQAALQRHGVIPPTTAPEEKPQSLLLQAIADLKPFGTTKQKMELAAQAAKGNPNVSVDIDPTTGRAFVIGAGSNNPDRIAMTALERRMNPIGKGMNTADRAANLAQMKAKLQSKRDEAAKKLAGGDLNELLAKGAKAGTKLAAGVAAVQQAKQLKQAATGNKNAALTPKEASAAFLSGQDEWTANKEAEHQKAVADAAAKAQKDMQDARIKAEKEVAQADRESRANEGELNRKNDVTIAQKRNEGFQQERYANAVAQEVESFKASFGRPPKSKQEWAIVRSNARNYLDQEDSVNSPDTGNQLIPVSAPAADPVSSQISLQATNPNRDALLKVLGIEPGAPSSQIGKRVAERMQSGSPLNQENISSLQTYVKQRNSADPSFHDKSMLSFPQKTFLGGSPGLAPYLIDELIYNSPEQWGGDLSGLLGRANKRMTAQEEAYRKKIAEIRARNEAETPPPPRSNFTRAGMGTLY